MVFIKEKSTDIFSRNEKGERFKTAVGQMVVGIELPGHRTLWRHGSEHTGDEEEELYVLDSNQPIERIADFFERTQTIPRDERPFYNCHNFAIHALTKADVFRRGYKITPGSKSFLAYCESAFASPPVDIGATQPGMAYTVETAWGDITHSIIGLNRPGHNVSVFGKGGDMVVTDNHTVMRVYHGTTLRQSVPVAC